MGMAGAALLALLTLAGCDGQRPEASAPPPVASTPPPAATPDLMGGPPEQAVQPAPEQQPAEERTFTSMAPVANPEDMTPEERAQVYGRRYDDLRWAGKAYAHPRHRVHAFIGHGRRASFGLAEHRRMAWRHMAHDSDKPRAAPLEAPKAAAHAAVAVDAGASRAATPAVAPPAATPVAAPSAAAASGAPATPSAQLGSSNLDWLSIPGAPYIALPGLGGVASRYVTAAVLLLLAIALLAIAAGLGRAAGRRRRPARNTVGAGPTFAAERPTDRTPDPADGDVAPFPHRHAEPMEN